MIIPDKSIVPCGYKSMCSKRGPGCLSTDEDVCPEAGNLSKKLCPMMVGKGYRPQACDCDMPSGIRAMVPQDYVCGTKDACNIPSEIRSKACAEGFRLTPELRKAWEPKIIAVFGQAAA
ncbi:MAG: hypothetical protein AUJ11_03095 [Parcubacteria group bacterium CG1_02_44_65]|nr:MAG: hypothetical protein AUJ11_03095 [Parcubacteria group bacterium CG1_02_44_65]